jgi:hypothetical protein
MQMASATSRGGEDRLFAKGQGFAARRTQVKTGSIAQQTEQANLVQSRKNSGHTTFLQSVQKLEEKIEDQGIGLVLREKDRSQFQKV